MVVHAPKRPASQGQADRIGSTWRVVRALPLCCTPVGTGGRQGREGGQGEGRGRGKGAHRGWSGRGSRRWIPDRGFAHTHIHQHKCVYVCMIMFVLVPQCGTSTNIRPPHTLTQPYPTHPATAATHWRHTLNEKAGGGVSRVVAAALEARHGALPRPVRPVITIWPRVATGTPRGIVSVSGREAPAAVSLR